MLRFRIIASRIVQGIAWPFLAVGTVLIWLALSIHDDAQEEAPLDLRSEEEPD